MAGPSTSSSSSSSDVMVDRQETAHLPVAESSDQCERTVCGCCCLEHVMRLQVGALLRVIPDFDFICPKRKNLTKRRGSVPQDEEDDLKKQFRFFSIKQRLPDLCLHTLDFIRSGAGGHVHSESFEDDETQEK
ncbi:hypothetical protein Q8A73_011237 [Channa argus]|nr:hypothetical protein Q8A73_011237 [Channa argus]